MEERVRTWGCCSPGFMASNPPCTPAPQPGLVFQGPHVWPLCFWVNFEDGSASVGEDRMWGEEREEARAGGSLSETSSVLPLSASLVQDGEGPG